MGDPRLVLNPMLGPGARHVSELPPTESQEIFPLISSPTTNMRPIVRRSLSWHRLLKYGPFFHLSFLLFAITLVDAAFIPFHNCLDRSTLDSDPLRLQFIPMFVKASLDASTDSGLDITIYGNVSGSESGQDYPSPGDPRWSDPAVTIGKIIDLDEANNKYSTLLARLDVLSFTPHSVEPTRFCDTLTNGECPLGPLFNANKSEPEELHAFAVSYNLTSSYSFSSISSIVRVLSGDAANSTLACIDADIIPDLGTTLRSALTVVPLVILLLVGFATIFAAVFSPWGTTDLFRWTSNYGRDEDLLRLVTPGFADCLQYIQFIILTGSLSLNYPGFYQPAVSQAAWSILMFNESLVSHGNGSQSLEDGVYTVNATYGLDRTSKYVGITDVQDIWAGMMVWLLVIVGGVVGLVQLGFAIRWIYHSVCNVPAEDLRSKNFPFTTGNVIRIVFNYLLLPIVSLSMFQLVVAASSPVYVVAMAVLLLVVLIGFAAWLLLLIAGSRPRSYLFDDLPTVLLYGPLYNTFCDNAAPFAVVSVFLTFVRGVAIGAVQPSGIAQIVLLAICEVALVLTLLAFHPFDYPTSMNAYHLVFSIIRCLALLLSVAFVPSLGVPKATRGWIGYIILLLHAMVLVFGFFLNAIQTIIEVAARLAGAGGEGGAGGGAARGGLVKVFGMRQLSRRVPRKRHIPRHSINSEAAMLGTDMERPSTQLDGERARSFSGSSAILLNRSAATESRVSGGFESGSLYGVGPSRAASGPYTPTTPGGVSVFSGSGQVPSGSGSPRSGLMYLKHSETADPYYRPPRQRRATLDGGGRRHGSWASGDLGRMISDTPENDTLVDPQVPGGDSPTPAYLGAPREDPDEDSDDPQQPRTDYAVREVDFYYRVRGPALSHSATRKLKTGPADPTGPVSSASGWLRNLFGGKTKEKGKGFEVVRSARAPPPGLMASRNRQSFPEPYRDDPSNSQNVGVSASNAPKSRVNGDEGEHPNDMPNDTPENTSSLLPAISASEAIELPSRVGSKSRAPTLELSRTRTPTIPRRSSKRVSSVEVKDVNYGDLTEIALTDEPSHSRQPPPDDSDRNLEQASSSRTLQPTRLPFGSKSSTHSGPVSIESGESSMNRETDDDSSFPQSEAASMERFNTVRRSGRPTSMGYVQQHRTSDHIHESPQINTPPAADSAEIIREP